MGSITTEILDAVLIIKLNRPDKFNSFNREMALLMQEALDNASTNDAIRCIYITGEGRAFCAGQDLSEAMDPNGPGIEKIVTEHYNPIIKKIRSVEKPVISGINGVAAGAGANIAFACDIVLASEKASFIQAFSKIGLVPDSGGTYFLPRLIGFHRAAALMMTGDKITAREAFDYGLVYKLYTEAELYSNGLKLAAEMAAMPTKALGLTKRLLNSGFNNSYEKQLEEEAKLQVEAAATYDYEEGVKAFLEKRQPLFKGR